MPESSMIILVIAVNVVFLGVLIWKAAWLMRKIRSYPTKERATGSSVVSAVDSVVEKGGADHSLSGQADAHEQADK